MSENTLHNQGDTGDASAFLPLPILHGELLRVLGPLPAEAAATVDPLTRLDEPVTAVGSCLAGVCDENGRLVLPLELTLTLDPATVVPNQQVPTAAIGERYRELPPLLARMPRVPGYEMLQQALISRPMHERGLSLGPLFFCRKRRCIFAARSPRTMELLLPMPDDRLLDAKTADGESFPTILLCWDNAAVDPDQPVDPDTSIYGGRGGSCSLGIIKSLDELITDQGRIVASVQEIEADDPPAAARLAEQHACVACSERERCYPKDDGYAYASDRLVPISAAAAPLLLRPFGAWRFDEVARVQGGMTLRDSLAKRESVSSEFAAWCAEQAREFDTTSPPRLLVGETDGRELIEIARMKLALIAELLAQLDVVWRETQRPHLCWTAETVRLAWSRPGATPALAWGFYPILRKIGLQPLAPHETRDGRPLPYPPAFSDEAYLPPRAVEAARYFDEPRTATLFIKRAQPDGDDLIVNVLLEELHVDWALFTIADTMHVRGDGWQAILSPAGQRDPNDGEGLPFSGRMRGQVDGLRKGDTVERIECRWYPRFGQATDLHAVGMLLFEGLLAHDERSIQSFREQLATEIAEVTTVCMGVPPEQREGQARAWLTERCETDAPAAIWTRRNLLYRRDDRNRTRLDSFAPALWQEIMTAALRMTTCIPGFSYCPDHACETPRLGGGFLLPLVEIRGLVALLDDQLVGRTAPAAGVREGIEKAE